MNPKEKAEELIKKFSDHSDWDHFDERGARVEHEKLCAIICVEQIIEGIESVIGDQKHMWREGERDQHQYYTKVLEHLKK